MHCFTVLSMPLCMCIGIPQRTSVTVSSENAELKKMNHIRSVSNFCIQSCYITRIVLAASRPSASPQPQCKIGKIHSTCSISRHKMSTTALGVDQSAVPNKRKHGSKLVETKLCHSVILTKPRHDMNETFFLQNGLFCHEHHWSVTIKCSVQAQKHLHSNIQSVSGLQT
jgi:hypothetical protein